MFTKLIMVIILQCMSIKSLHCAPSTYTVVSVNYISDEKRKERSLL